MSSDIVWTPVDTGIYHEQYKTETAGYVIQVHRSPHPHKAGELIWGFHVKSKDGNYSISGHNHGYSRQDVENYAFAWVGARSVGRFIGLKRVPSHDGWGTVWVADAKL